MKKLSTLRGFTLIEILIAIAIIGVLAVASMAMINPLEQIKKGRDAQRKQDLRQMQFALDAYNTDTNRYPAASGEQINGIAWGTTWQPYMAKLPKDPLSTQSYRYESDGRYYRLYAKLEKCPDPQMIPGANCEDYNYSATSPNIVASLLPTPTPIPPTSTPIPPTPTPAPPKYVFVTSTQSNGDLVNYVIANIDNTFTDNGLKAGDKICQTRANAVPALNGKTWKAWLSTSSVNAKDRILDTEYRLVNNTTIVANNKADLTTDDGDGNYLKNPINTDENGNIVNIIVNDLVWTGTLPSGSLYPIGGCSSWESPSDGARAGRSSNKNFAWSSGNSVSCSSSLRLYCFEQ